MQRALLRVLLVLASAGVSGCSTPLCQVSGKITIAGKTDEFKNLRIVFLGRDGHLIYAPLNEDGSYRAANVPAGEVKTAILYIPPVPPGTVHPARPGEDFKQIRKAPNPIPGPLRDPSTSKLT